MIFTKFLYWHSPEGTTIVHPFDLLVLCCLFDSISGGGLVGYNREAGELPRPGSRRR